MRKIFSFFLILVKIIFSAAFILGMAYVVTIEWREHGNGPTGFMMNKAAFVVFLVGILILAGKDKSKAKFLIFLLLPLGGLSAQEAQEKEKAEFVLGFMNTPEIAKYEKVEAGLYIRPMIARFGEKTNQILLYSLKEKSVEFAFDVKLPHRMLVTCFLSKNVQKDYESKHYTNPSYLSFGLEKSLFNFQKKKIIFADVSFFIEGRKHFDDKKIIPVVGINMIHGFKLN